ncbi:MAG: KamA family radical SAM protein [Myxococcota bacterium]|nr:KamA family radical SAM protein [Myxococcota bacterium]
MSERHDPEAAAGVRLIDQDIRGVSDRGPWGDVPDAQWSDWRWQQQNRVRSLDELSALISLTAAEREAFAACSARFKMAITPYYAALMDPDDPTCPIRRQAVPDPAELEPSPVDLVDPLGEEASMPVPGLTHRYPDRALLYATHNCPVYCRHCTRKRKVGDPSSAASHQQLEGALDYLRQHPEIRDVLVSGGDPMSLSDDRLVDLLGRLRAIPHLALIRLCTRNPVTLPHRFTPALLARLATHQPLFVHTHFNHPAECTPEAARCLRALADAGLNVANQMVLLRGINDQVETVREVNLWLLRQRCRPYYLFQADLAQGVAHFRTPLRAGLDIIRGLRGFSSGMAVPHFVIDAPGGGGKVPLLPDYVVRRDADEIVVRTYTGDEYSYPVR